MQLYGEQLKKPNTTLVECHGFDGYFDQQLRELDKSSTANATSLADQGAASGINDDAPSTPSLTYRGKLLNSPGAKDPTSADSTPVQTPGTSRPSTPSSSLLTAKGGPIAKMSRRARKAQNSNSAPASSGDESPGNRKKTGKEKKKGRKWDDDGFAAEEEDDLQLDYSAQADDSNNGAVKSSAVDAVDSSEWGTSTKGKFVLRDLGDEVHGILATAEADKAAARAASKSGNGLFGSGVNAISGLFRNVVGGKTLTKEDLDKAMKGMEEHLLRKNVAREAAIRLCEGVSKELIGTKTGNFEGKAAPVPVINPPSYTFFQVSAPRYKLRWRRL